MVNRRSFTAPAILLLLLGATALAQGEAQPQAIPARRLVNREDVEHREFVDEIFRDLEASAGKPGDRVAMRICTKDPLPAALFTAIVNTLSVGEALASGIRSPIAYSAERVMILRSPDCPITHPPYVPVEFWGVPRGAALPPAVESVRLCQIKVSGTSWLDRTNKNFQRYKLALKETLKEWRDDSSVIIGVYGSYYVRPSPSMVRGLREAKAFFRRHGLPLDKYFVRLKPSSSYDSNYPYSEPRFPNLVLVRVARECEVD